MRVNNTLTNRGLTPAGEGTYSGVFEAGLYEALVNSKYIRYSKLRTVMVPFCGCPASNRYSEQFCPKRVKPDRYIMWLIYTLLTSSDYKPTSILEHPFE